jgi:hypothetical protein
MSRRTARLLVGLVMSAGVALVPTAASAAPLPDVLPLKKGSRPEGVAAGPGSTYFAGAMSNGAIYRGDVRTGSRSLLVAGTDNTAARGMQYDAASGVLWVAGDVRLEGGGTRSTVTAYDAGTGRLLRRLVIPGQRFLNDLQVTRDAVYVTDSIASELVVVTLSGFRLLPLSGDWEQAAGSFGANGIRLLDTGDLVVVNSGNGGLYRVSPATGRADRIELTGTALSSGDGLVVQGSTVYVVNGFATDAIAVVELGAGARTGAVVGRLRDSDLDRPATAFLSAGALYAVNARFTSVPDPTPTTPYDLVRVALAP